MPLQNKLHLEILSKEQADLLPFLKQFGKSYYLVGGTAIALHLGHRHSIDFDLFATKKLQKSNLRRAINNIPFNKSKLFEDVDQIHYLINGVKLTFFLFPYTVSHPLKIDTTISLPLLLDLAAMKAFALGRRAKWKDYVDLYFIIKDHYTIQEISQQASQLFKHEFSEKLFREQLSFHSDIDYSEQVEYLVPVVSEAEIKSFLVEKAIDIM